MEQEKRITFADFASQGTAVEGLRKNLSEGSYVHAYLFTGMEGVGKRTLARLTAQSLLCRSENKPCGCCPACIQVQQENHPDLLVIRPGQRVEGANSSSTAKGIIVADIRAAVLIAGMHTYEGGNRVVILQGADKMNPEASNALLKTLEEPIPGVVFILLCENQNQLLPTIVSRCRNVQLHPWPDEMIRRILTERNVPPQRAEQAVEQCGGSIGKAVQIAGDEAFWENRQEIIHELFGMQHYSQILSFSDSWKDRKDQADVLLDQVEDILRGILLVRLGLRRPESLGELAPKWQAFAKKAEVKKIAGLMESVNEARRMKQSNVTWQAALERLVMRIMEESNQWST